MNEIRPKVKICGVEVDNYSFDEVITIMTEQALSCDCLPSYVVTPNASHILLLQDDEYFREIYQKAFLVIPDRVHHHYSLVPPRLVNQSIDRTPQSQTQAAIQ